MTSDISKSIGLKNLKNSEVSRISCRTFSESFKKINFFTSRYIYIYIYIVTRQIACYWKPTIWEHGGCERSSATDQRARSCTRMHTHSYAHTLFQHPSPGAYLHQRVHSLQLGQEKRPAAVTAGTSCSRTTASLALPCSWQQQPTPAEREKERERERERAAVA